MAGSLPNPENPSGDYGNSLSRDGRRSSEAGKWPVALLCWDFLLPTRETPHLVFSFCTQVAGGIKETMQY